VTILTERSEIEPILATPGVVAVLGASVRPGRAGLYVPHYLQGQGFDVYPVNPDYAGDALFGRTVVATLAEVPVPIDVVDVFRRSDRLPQHLDEILALSPLPTTVWFQMGVRHDRVARALSDAGIAVVQDRCMLADHQYWIGTR
jgi:predicted CoA-binding protein